MAKKKGQSAKHVAKQEPQKAQSVSPSKRGSKTVWIVAAVAIVAVIAGYAVSKSGGSAGGSPVATPEEAKYIGRYLPEAYQEPKVGEGGAVSADTPMTPVSATTDESGLSVALADVVSNRNVSFEYKKADGNAVPLVAYVKPSGKLFVGVSYCVPCQGTGQTLTTDGMLTCDACGTKRDIESGVGISGACKLYPLDELPVKIVGEQVVIEKAALDSWVVQPTDRKVGG